MAYNFNTLTQNYQKAINIVSEDLKLISTGRAKPSLVEDIKVEAYGSYMPLNELASISAPDAQMILIQPYDQSVVEATEKALQKSNFNPNVDGNQIRIVIPALTGEKRQQLIKQVSQHIESGKQMIRSQRTEAKKDIENQKGDEGISEDDIKADLDQLDKVTQEYIQKLEQVGEAKQAELAKI